MDRLETVECFTFATPAIDIPPDGLGACTFSDGSDTLIDEEFVRLAEFANWRCPKHLKCALGMEHETGLLQVLSARSCGDM